MIHDKNLDDAIRHRTWVAHHEDRKRRAYLTPKIATSVADGAGQQVSLQDYYGVDEQMLHDLIVKAVVADADEQIAYHRDHLNRLWTPAVTLAPRFSIVDEEPAPVRRPVKAAKRRAA